MIIIEYPKCSTCKKAVAFLEKHNLDFATRNIKEDTPSKDELQKIISLSNLDIDKFFNTSGLVYRELNLKEKLKDMSFEEKLTLLSSNGMLIKRPILVTDEFALVGFKEKEWEDRLWEN